MKKFILYLPLIFPLFAGIHIHLMFSYISIGNYLVALKFGLFALLTVVMFIYGTRFRCTPLGYLLFSPITVAGIELNKTILFLKIDSYVYAIESLIISILLLSVFFLVLKRM